MSAPWLAFDIETANLLPQGADLDAFGPLDISVVAAVSEDGAARVVHSLENGKPAAKLNREDAAGFLRWLRERQLGGARIVAWNGVSFDLKMIGHAAGDLELASEVALDSFDPMLQFFYRRGFPIGLQSVATGMGLGLKKSMSGADAPEQWAKGNFQQVIEYVQGDCRMTLEIARAIEKVREVRWNTKRGTISSERMFPLLPAREVIAGPLPDQSWMDTPIPPAKFTSWFPRNG
jgi:hypothetical protein